VTEEEFERIKEQVDSLQRQSDRVEGELNAILKEIKEKFGCRTLEEAKRLLDKMSKETSALEKQVKKKQKAFDMKWGDTLEQLDEES
jgi:hypothetical protein